MKPVKQEHLLGCAIACLAFLLGIKYREVIALIENGEEKAITKGFWSNEIIEVLSKFNLSYKRIYVKKGEANIVIPDSSIILIRKSQKYPLGHYFAYQNNQYMDPWINVPELKVKAGFRKALPNEPWYIIVRI